MEIKLVSNKCCLSEIQSIETAMLIGNISIFLLFFFSNAILSQLDGHEKIMISNFKIKQISLYVWTIFRIHYSKIKIKQDKIMFWQHKSA